MKNLLSIFAFVLCAGFVSCSEEYDADTAVSHYQPLPGKRLVSSVKTTFTTNGGEDVHEHNFTYDAKNRIKAVRSNIVVHTSVIVNNGGFKDTIPTYCNLASGADYFYRGEELEVAYTVSVDYPEFPGMNSYTSSSVFGNFNSNGVLNRFSQVSFEYSSTRLQQAYVDGGTCFDLTRDGDGNITGYKKYNVYTDQVYEDCTGRYHYHPIKNKTNFDFSAYFGYWGVEQGVPLIGIPYRAPYQLAAFGMIGETCRNLPFGVIEKNDAGEDEKVYGEWELDSQDYPLSYIDTDGRKTVITYCE